MAARFEIVLNGERVCISGLDGDGVHRRVIELTGGADGVRDLAGVGPAVVKPQMTFDGDGLYPTLIDKAAAICFSLVLNHPFKRIGHAAMETFLLLNGHELDADVDDAESLFLKLAATNDQALRDD